MCRYLPDGTLLYANRAYAAFHGHDEASLVGRNLVDLVPADLRPAVASTLVALRSITPADSVRRNEHASRSATGEASWYEWTDKAFFSADGTLRGFMAVGRDVTSRRVSEAQSSHLALHDPLTGVWNRRGLLAHLDDRLETLARAPSHGVAVLYLDLDDFKGLNDEHGHRAGDQSLVRTAEVLQAALLTGDVVGRMGGDELLMICEGIAAESSMVGLRARIEGGLRGLSPSVAVSVGCVVARPSETADDILHRADQAMYAEKRRKAATTIRAARGLVELTPALPNRT